MDERWREVERIFHAARELRPSVQAAFLESACGGNASLRREVETLLAQVDEAGSFLETPAIELAARDMAVGQHTALLPQSALEPGAVIAHYRVTGKLGAGGMGEVYRARDTKLNREVALKILPGALAQDPQRMARFEREAKVLASLNHPNIAAIYGLEESNDISALVMELVEGQTLAERIAARPLTRTFSTLSPQAGRQAEVDGSSDSLAIAKQIAEALEYAHERGIIHRDLKPANVKITHEGTVKVLDFGLAKVLSLKDLSETPDLNSSPTVSAAATEMGMILGTAAYMSPEQAKGQRVDQRCDIWAFGCVLYEMLTGVSAFGRPTIMETLAAVMTDDVDLEGIPSSTPAAIKKLVQRCLTKDFRKRLQSIGEARITIEDAIAGAEADRGSLPELASKPGPLHAFSRALAWALCGVAVTALIGAAFLWKFSAHKTQELPGFFYVPPPSGTTFRDFGFGAGPVSISPDGTKLAFSATDEKGSTELYVRPLASERAQSILGTDDGAWPFWSPDGHSLGFFADQKLKTVNLDNGTVQVLADALEDVCNGGGAWSPDRVILFTPHGCNGPLDAISASGGNPRPATELQKGTLGQTSPFFLPGGRRFLFLSTTAGAAESIWMGSLDSSSQSLVLNGADLPQFASGHLLFIRNSRVFAQPFDPASGKLSGEGVALAEAQTYSVSESGVLAFQGGTPRGRLEWFDRNGNALGEVGPTGEYWAAKISPDGERILADIGNPESGMTDLWSYPVAGGVGTRLTFKPGIYSLAVWSPDGRNIAYSCFPGGAAGVCTKPADGSGSERTLLTMSLPAFFTPVIDWSPDGRYISFDERSVVGAGMQNWVAPLFGNRKPFQVAPVNAVQFDGSFSPDGRWFAYFSYETGRPEVYVVPFPGPGGKYQISQNGGWDVRWDKKGHLYFMTMGDRLMEADLESSGNSLQVKAIHTLFQLSLPDIATMLYDVNADGSRFLVIAATDPNASRLVGMLLDWQAMLKEEK